MYWNEIVDNTELDGGKINRNMRCIEMQEAILQKAVAEGLIETWDVLKFSTQYPNDDNVMINRNMRCIEITQLRSFSLPAQWLIETWDVLKCVPPAAFTLDSIRLIKTWDVLKFPQCPKDHSPACPINRNMRCIEIMDDVYQGENLTD